MAAGTPQEYWDHIREYEVDPSWRENLSPEYLAYREEFSSAQRRTYHGDFPLAIEIEASYHCNLQCPFCPRVVKIGEREIGHMSPGLWGRIISEARAGRLKSILMDHEAESLMNPRFFEMLRDARDAGILDIWLHTNATLLTPERSEKLIDGGLTRINFSIDAVTPDVYARLRVGGRYEQVVQNVRTFLRLKQEKGARHLRTRVSFVEQRENAHQRRAFYDLWRGEPGLNMIAFQEYIDFSPFEAPDADAALSEAELEAKYAGEPEFHCSVPWEYPVIDTEGNVMPCGSPVREHTRDFVLGNMHAGDTIASCWNGDKMRDLRQLHTRGEWYKNPMCRVCVNTMRRSRTRLESWRLLPMAPG
jgi:radical SAM protein with 4Fe4S-binding SPASM domain